MMYTMKSIYIQTNMGERNKYNGLGKISIEIEIAHHVVFRKKNMQRI